MISVVCYSEKFGLYHVDFNDPQRKRTPKISARVYAHICKTHTIDWNYRPALDTEQIHAMSRLSEFESSSGTTNYVNQVLVCISLLTISAYLGNFV